MLRNPYSLDTAIVGMAVHSKSGGGGCVSPTRMGFGGLSSLSHPPDPSRWPHKETDGAPGIAQKSCWLLAV